MISNRVLRGAALLCLIGLTLNNSVMLAVAAKPQKQKGTITYAELGDKLLSSYGTPENNPSESPKKDEVEKPKLDIVQLSEQEKLKMVCTMFARQEKEQSLNNAYEQMRVDAMRMLIDDQEIFTSHDQLHPQDHMFGRIDLTETKVGKVALAKMLASPAHDVRQLKKRQVFIQELVENEEMLKQLDAVVQEIKKAESAFFSFWMEDNKATQDLINALYPTQENSFLGKYVFKGVNKKAPFLESYTRLGNLGTVYQCGGDYITMGLEFYLYRAAFAKLGVPIFTSMSPTVWGSIKYGLSLLNPIGYFQTYYQLGNPSSQTITFAGNQLNLPPVGSDPAKDFARKVIRTLNFSGGTATTAMLVYKGYLIKKAIEAARLCKNTANLLQSRLIGAAAFVDGIKKIEVLGMHNDLLKIGLMSYTKIEPILRGSFVASPDFKALITMLQTNTFKGNASFFSYTGRVLSAYKHMQEHKDSLAAVLEIIGELDACLSIAKLVKKYEHERVGYCFVEYAEQDTPYVNMQDFWNPLVDHTKVVTNSIELGARNGARDVILTGSNTGGKSTVLKAITLDVLMAQTFGIAPASRMIMTPFAFIGSSMNIVDNTAQGISLYQAEVNRAATLIKCARETQALGLFAFIVMDELFRGTSPEKADKETYECAKHLYNCPNTIFMLATHYFNNPLKLEAETDGVCKNYKVDAYIDELGNIIRTYKLEPGVSKNNIANNILDEALNKAIV
jgi:hypothetical protein